MPPAAIGSFGCRAGGGAAGPKRLVFAGTLEGPARLGSRAGATYIHKDPDGKLGCNRQVGSLKCDRRYPAAPLRPQSGGGGLDRALVVLGRGYKE